MNKVGLFSHAKYTHWPEALSFRRLDWKVGAVAVVIIMAIGVYLIANRRSQPSLKNITADQLGFSHAELRETFNGVSRRQACQEILDLLKEAYRASNGANGIILTTTEEKSPVVKYEKFGPPNAKAYKVHLGNETLCEETFVWLILTILMRKGIIENIRIVKENFSLRLKQSPKPSPQCS